MTASTDLEREYDRLAAQVGRLIALLAEQSERANQLQLSLMTVTRERDAQAAERLRLQAKIEDAQTRVRTLLSRLPDADDDGQLDLLATMITPPGDALPQGDAA